MANLDSKIKSLVAKGQLDKAFEILEATFSSMNEDLANDIILLSSRFSQLKDQARKNTKSEELRSVERSRIEKELLVLTKDLPEELGIKSSRFSENLSRAIKEIGETSSNLKTMSVDLPKIRINSSGLASAVKAHRIEMKKWASFLNFKDNPTKKLTSKVFVDLEYYVTPRRLIQEGHTPISVPLMTLFSKCKDHLILLGQPGAGKTTTMKKVVSHFEGFQATMGRKLSFPIVIRLRDLNEMEKGEMNSNFLYERILSILGIAINVTQKNFSKDFLVQLVRRKTVELLDKLQILLILDGYDELQAELKPSLCKQLEKLSWGLESSMIILTTRSGDLSYSFDQFDEYEVCPLSDAQIKSFVHKWIQDEEQSIDLYSQILDSPFADTAMRPLTLAHLCALYEVNKKIPEKPKTVYKKVVNLLLEEWDQQKDVIRKSRYSGFEVDRKSEFLAHLSFQLTTEIRKSVFSVGDLEMAYGAICKNFSLPRSEGEIVVDELESHTGIFIVSGFGKYEFSHKSIQEYLTADYLTRLPIIPKKLKITNHPHEFAVATALSSNPTIFLVNLILNTLEIDEITLSFVKSFWERLVSEKPDMFVAPELGLTILYLHTLLLLKGEDKSTIAFLLDLEQVEQFKDSIQELSEFYIEDNSLTGYLKDNWELWNAYKGSQGNYASQVSNQYLRENELRILKRTQKFENYKIQKSPPFLLINKSFLAHFDFFVFSELT